jgi:hypothetical protein
MAVHFANARLECESLVDSSIYGSPRSVMAKLTTVMYSTHISMLQHTALTLVRILDHLLVAEVAGVDGKTVVWLAGGNVLGEVVGVGGRVEPAGVVEVGGVGGCVAN